MNQTIEVNIIEVLNKLDNKIDILDSKINKLTTFIYETKTDIVRSD